MSEASTLVAPPGAVEDIAPASYAEVPPDHVPGGSEGPEISGPRVTTSGPLVVHAEILFRVALYQAASAIPSPSMSPAYATLQPPPGGPGISGPGSRSDVPLINQT